MGKSYLPYKFVLLMDIILISSFILLGWKAAFLCLFLSILILLFLATNLGYLYFIILISPLGSILGLDFQTIRIWKWIIISSAIILAAQKLLITSRQILLPKTKINTFVMLFLLLSIATTILSLDPNKSFLELLRITSFFGLFYLVFNTVRTEQEVKRIVNFWIAVLVLICLYGIYQHFLQGIDRIYATFSNANSLGVFCFVTSPLILSMGISTPKRNWKMLYYTSFLLLLLALFLTGSRASWIACLVSITTVSILLKGKKVLINLSLFATIFIAIILILPPLRSNLVEITRFSFGLTGRPLLWASGFNLIKDHLFWGVGLDAVGETLYQYSVIKIPSLQYWLHGFFVVGNLHSLYLQVVAEMGILGLFIVLFFFKNTFTEMKELLKKSGDSLFKALSATGVALILGTFVHSLFETSNVIGAGSYASYFWLFLGLVYAASQINKKSDGRFNRKHAIELG